MHIIIPPLLLFPSVTIWFCPHFYFLLPYLFSHVTSCHWAITWSVTWLSSHDCLIVLTSSLFTAIVCLIRGRLLFYLLLFPLSPLFLPYCLDPYCSLGSIVCLHRTLSQVAASVVYKLACIVERGLKPDLVFNPSVVAPPTFFVLSPSLSISSPFGSPQGLLRLSLHLPSS